MAPGNRTDEIEQSELWVVQGELDLPAILAIPEGGENFWVFGKKDDAEGFAELAPLDPNRSAKRAIWSSGNPLVCRFRQYVQVKVWTLYCRAR